MRRYCLLLLVLCAELALCVPMKPTKKYLDAMKHSLDAEDQLLICRSANYTENLKDIECFMDALRLFPYNASWAKQAGALYVMTAQRRKAYHHFNHSFSTILDANGMLNNAKLPKDMPPVTWLKLYHTREKSGSLELAKVWFQSLQMEHQTMEAKKIVDEFIEPLEDYEESMDLFRVIGSIVDVVKVRQEWRAWKEETQRKKGKKVKKQEEETTVNIVGEEMLRIAEELSNRWLSAPLTISPRGKNDSIVFSKTTCGLPFKFKDTYTAAEMMHYLSVCIAKWGELKTHLKSEGSPVLYGALLRTALHTISGFATEYVTRSIVEMYPDLAKTVDNFGSTPLHLAAAMGNRRGLSVLAKHGGMEAMKHKDAGNFSPLQLGCSNTFFRTDMEAILEAEFGQKGACSPYTVIEKFTDDITDEEDDGLLPGGGWKDAVPDSDVDCAFDVRSGTSISHHELIGRYLHSSRPIVLRGVIPSHVRKALERKKFIPAFKDMWVRKEEFPAAELYGGKLFNITNIHAWTKQSNETFGTIEVNKKHKLSKLIHWLPERLVPSKEGYTTTDDSWPMLILAGRGARTNYAFRSSHYAHAVVHGVQHWTVLSPTNAKTTRNRMQLDVAEPGSMKCTLQSGDVLVLPSLWSGAYWSKGESIGFSRRFIWK